MANPPNDQTVKTIVIPYIHPKVDTKDLLSNNKLFSDAQIAIVKENVHADFQGRLTKKNLNKSFQDEIDAGLITPFKFSLEKVGNELFAIYKGKEHSLGSGSFGSVKILQNLTTGETTEALKVLKDPDTTQQDIEREKEGLEIANQFKSSYKRFDKDNQFEIVMKLAKGCSLKDLEERNLPAVVWLDIMKDVMTEVKNLHAKGVLHRDIKPENIHYDLITRTAIVIDMGLAIYTPDVFNGVSNAQICGTPAFMSPDVFNEVYNEKTELFALGVTFAEMLDLVEYKSVHFDITGEDYIIPVIQAADKPFQENVIADDNTRLAMLAMVQEMTNPNANISLTSREGHTNVIEFLDKIRNEYLDTLGLTNRVVFLDVEDLKGDPLEVGNMLLTLKQYNTDQVWLVDNNGANQNEYLNSRDLLSRFGLDTNNAVVQYDGNNLEQTMQNYANQRERSDANIYDASFITKTRQIVSLQSQLESEQINKVISSLKIEASVLLRKAGKNPEPRVAMINDAVAAFEKVKNGGAVSLVAVLKDLDKLQHNMLGSKVAQQNIQLLMQILEQSAKTPSPTTVRKPKDWRQLLEDIDEFKGIKKPVVAKAIVPPLPPRPVVVSPAIRPPLPPRPVAVRPPLPARPAAVPPPIPQEYAKKGAVPPPVPPEYAKKSAVPPPVPAEYAKKTAVPPLPKPEAAPVLAKGGVADKFNKVLNRFGLFGGAKDKTPDVQPSPRKNKI